MSAVEKMEGGGAFFNLTWRNGDQKHSSCVLYSPVRNAQRPKFSAVGVIPHGQELAISADNVRALRAMADEMAKYLNKGDL